MPGLEGILGNFGKGTVTGVVRALDPVGSVLSEVDRWATGAGYSSGRAPRTLHNLVYQGIYNDPEEKVELANGYVPRAIGNVVGFGTVGLGIYGLYSYFGPIAAFAVPVATGIYSLFKTVARYVHDFVRGEKVGEKQYEKASFYDGFRYGWHKSTHFVLPYIHQIEGNLTGRGFDNSVIESTIKGSSSSVRRNFESFAGQLFGSVVGSVASIASFFILPIYKSIRDVANTFEGKEADAYEPAFKITREKPEEGSFRTIADLAYA